MAIATLKIEIYFNIKPFFKSFNTLDVTRSRKCIFFVLIQRYIQKQEISDK